jgi:hypothetical protein
MNHLSELLGKIIHKEPRKVYDKKSPFHGNAYYKLKVLAENQETHTFFVYPNLVNSALWKALKENHYVDKRYLFYGAEKKRGFVLYRWEELRKKEVSHA